MKSFKLFLKENIITSDIKNILSTISGLRSKIVNKNLGSLDITEILNSNMKKYFIEFQSSDDYSEYPSQDFEDVGVRSSSIDDNGHIIVYVEFDTFWKTFDSNEVKYDIETSWKTFINVLDKLVSHEMIHRSQLSKMIVKKSSRKHGDYDEDSYFTNPQEMMAWAHDCIKEYIFAGYDKDTIAKILKDPYNSFHRVESDSMYRYTNYFEAGSKEIKQYLKYCYQYLESLG